MNILFSHFKFDLLFSIFFLIYFLTGNKIHKILLLGFPIFSTHPPPFFLFFFLHVIKFKVIFCLYLKFIPSLKKSIKFCSGESSFFILTHTPHHFLSVIVFKVILSVSTSHSFHNYKKKNQKIVQPPSYPYL